MPFTTLIFAKPQIAFSEKNGIFGAGRIGTNVEIHETCTALTGHVV